MPVARRGSAVVADSTLTERTHFRPQAAWLHPARARNGNPVWLLKTSRKERRRGASSTPCRKLSLHPSPHTGRTILRNCFQTVRPRISSFTDRTSPTNDIKLFPYSRASHNDPANGDCYRQRCRPTQGVRGAIRHVQFAHGLFNHRPCPATIQLRYA